MNTVIKMCEGKCLIDDTVYLFEAKSGIGRTAGCEIMYVLQ